MTSKQRLLSAMRGQSVDRTPWSPFLAYWWEAQGEDLTRRGQLEFLEGIGADPLLRGFGAAWKIEFKDVNIRQLEKPADKREVWETPVGSLQLGYRLSGLGNTWFLTDHPVKEIEDFKVLQWIYEHAILTYNPELDGMLRQTGERGLVLPLVGSECKTCFQSLVEKWVGIENLAYFLSDDPDSVQECLAVMRRVSDRTAEFSAESPAEAFIFWEDSSTTNISPAMFDRYTAPEITAWGNTLHSAGKMLIHHACGHIRDLLPRMARTPIDAIESISPPPTGNVDIPEAFDALPPHIALIGGIEPVFFQNCTSEELDARVRRLLACAKGRRFVLANSDSCPPGVEAHKFSGVVRILEKCPL